MHFQTFRFWIHATVLGQDTEQQIPQSEIREKSATGADVWTSKTDHTPAEK